MPHCETIILAGGFSSRMQGFKPLYPLGNATVLERAVAAFRDAGVERVLVVTGYRAGDLAPAISATNAEPVFNPGYDQGMFTSVQAGVRSLSRDCESFFVLPVDIPLVRPATVARLMDAFHNDASVLYPNFQGERGHPPVLAACLREPILGHTGEGGLRGVLAQEEEQRPERVRDVAVADQAVLLDMDREEQYRRLQARQQGMRVPTPEECEALFHMAATPHHVRGHCRAVSLVARELGRAWRNGGKGDVDLEFIVRAALLHDVGKGSKPHETTGGRMLARAGFEEMGRVVACHGDVRLAGNEPITEAEIVFLADKLVIGEQAVSLDQRFQAALERYGHESEVKQAILGRWERAKAVADRYEAESGADLFLLAETALAPNKE